MAHKNKPKATNKSKKMPNGSASAEEVPNARMDIWTHISDISTVKGPRYVSTFVPLKGPGRAERDRMVNQRNFPQPKNLQLVETEEDKEKIENGYDFHEFVDENSILADIRAMQGGRECSDRFLTKRWTKLPEKDEDATGVTDAKTDGAKTSKLKSNRDVFARNVGMRAIMQQKMANNVDFPSLEETTKKSAVNSNQDGKNVGANSCKFPFVQDEVDPDFAYRQFCGVENDDDFVVPRVGKIAAVTAREYLIRNTVDSDFVFSDK